GNATVSVPPVGELEPEVGAGVDEHAPKRSVSAANVAADPRKVPELIFRPTHNLGADISGLLLSYRVKAPIDMANGMPACSERSTARSDRCLRVMYRWPPGRVSSKLGPAGSAAPSKGSNEQQRGSSGNDRHRRRPDREPDGLWRHADHRHR